MKKYVGPVYCRSWIFGWK